MKKVWHSLVTHCWSASVAEQTSNKVWYKLLHIQVHLVIICVTSVASSCQSLKYCFLFYTYTFNLLCILNCVCYIDISINIDNTLQYNNRVTFSVTVRDINRHYPVQSNSTALVVYFFRQSTEVVRVCSLEDSLFTRSFLVVPWTRLHWYVQIADSW